MKNSPLRSLSCALFLSASFVTATAQTQPAPATKPVKTMTPRRQQSLRKQATDAADTINAQSDACPVRPDQPLVVWRSCLADAVTKADAAYKSYIAAIRTLLLTPKPEEVDDTGMQLWYADNMRDFDAAARAWLAYFAAQCKSETSTVEPGSGMAETQSNCQLTLLKDRVQRVNVVYGGMVGLTPAKP